MNRRDLLKSALLLAARRPISLLTPGRARRGWAPLQGLERYIGDVMARFGVPGAAVAIVVGDETVFSRGFGVRDLDTREPVNERTLFCLASNTKPFTGTCLAMLESDGALHA